ncbi:hypothetical protein ACWEQL_15770 [Kitasatospora sp. NPDC004240]
MSTVPAAPRVPSPKNQKSTSTRPSGSTAATGPGRRHHPFRTAVRNVGIALDTAARVVFLGRDGV